MKHKNYKNTTPKVGDTYSLGDASFTIISPNQTYTETNDNSVSILLIHKENTF